MGQWSSLILTSAAKYSLPSHWLAGIMVVESGGHPGLCAKQPDGSCAQNEGAGLMAILPSTAQLLAGRRVTSQELMSDNALSIDLGAKYLRMNLDTAANGGDFVMAAVSYNAGSVRCGSGKVWRPAGSTLDRPPCPTTWGVIMGCVEFPTGSGKIVVNDYPRAAIKAANAALNSGLHAGPPLAIASVGSGSTGMVLGMVAAAAAGFYATSKLRNRAR
jgi:hypothetical protein